MNIRVDIHLHHHGEPNDARLTEILNGINKLLEKFQISESDKVSFEGLLKRSELIARKLEALDAQIPRQTRIGLER